MPPLPIPPFPPAPPALAIALGSNIGFLVVALVLLIGARARARA